MSGFYILDSSFTCGDRNLIVGDGILAPIVVSRLTHPCLDHAFSRRDIIDNIFPPVIGGGSVQIFCTITALKKIQFEVSIGDDSELVADQAPD